MVLQAGFTADGRKFTIKRLATPARRKPTATQI